MLLNERGQSLVQVLISVAIMGVIMTAMTAMQASQSNESRALTEKLSALELTRATTSSVATAACNLLFDPANLVNPAANSFNPTTVTPAAPHVIHIKRIPAPGITTLSIATAGSPASPLSNSLNILPPTPPNSGLKVEVTGPNTANLVVTFDQNTLVRAVKNLNFPLHIQTSVISGSNHKIDGCLGTTPLGIPTGTTCGLRQAKCEMWVGGPSSMGAVARYDGNWTGATPGVKPTNVPCMGNSLTITCAMVPFTGVHATGVNGCPAGYLPIVSWGFDDTDPSTGQNKLVYTMYCAK